MNNSQIVNVIRNYPCPVEGCRFEFLDSHYTSREPHLQAHTNKQLARAIQRLLGRREWADTMAREIIESCKTLQIYD